MRFIFGLIVGVALTIGAPRSTTAWSPVGV